jgi:nuclear transport factor 2 (NTF2) superfamily protein
MDSEPFRKRNCNARPQGLLSRAKNQFELVSRCCRVGVVPEFRERDALRKFFEARRAKQKGYRLNKQFRTLVNDVMTNVWEGEWEDAGTGQRMKGFGVETSTMRGGKIAIWEAAFNAAPADQDVDASQALR